MNNQDKMKKLLDVLEENDDMFFSTGDVDRDIGHVERVIQNQGYWAGEANRYYFDSEFNILDIEGRVFGR